MSLKIGVIGAGAMGTAIAQVISENTEELLLFARREKVCEDINNKHYNEEYYPNIKLHENIKATNNLEDFKDMDVIFLCIPSSNIRETTEALKNIISENSILVSTAKGLEHKTNKRMSEIIEEIICRPAVVLSGPNIASEMMENLFTATTIASTDKSYVKRVKKALNTEKFKVDTNGDVIGTEYCGIIKNVLAISQGIFEGMDINDNAKFAVFTKSYLETKDIIEKLGGKRDTVDNYCGFGDIITASTLSVSRNHTLGVLYGQGIIIDEKASGVLFEGKNTTSILKHLCDKLEINSLTVNFVYDVIIEKKNAKQSFTRLWNKL